MAFFFNKTNEKKDSPEAEIEELNPIGMTFPMSKASMSNNPLKYRCGRSKISMYQIFVFFLLFWFFLIYCFF